MAANRVGYNDAAQAFGLANEYRCKGELEAALKALEDAAALNGQVRAKDRSTLNRLLEWTYICYGQTFREMRQFNAALDYYNRAAEVFAVAKDNDRRPNQIVFFLRANTRVIAGDAAGALEDYQYLLEHSALAYGRTGISFVMPCPQDAQMAIEDTTYALDAVGRQELAYFARALAKQMAGDWNGALADCDLALRAAPQNELIGKRLAQQKAQIEELLRENEKESKQIDPHQKEKMRPNTEYFNLKLDFDGGYAVYEHYFTITDEGVQKEKSFADYASANTYLQDVAQKLAADGWKLVSEKSFRGLNTSYYQRQK
jgi:hypothetical protein